MAALPVLLALPLEEAVRRLKACGCRYQLKTLLTPRQRMEDFNGKKVRQYVVRQQLDADQLLLTVVVRQEKEDELDGVTN